MSHAAGALPGVADRYIAAILTAAEVVIDRFGPDGLSLTHVAPVSLIPLAKIYRYFEDTNALLGALSARALSKTSNDADARNGWGGGRSESQRLDYVIDRFAKRLNDAADAYLILGAPFDFEFAAECVFVAFQHSHSSEGTVTLEATRVAQRAAQRFVGADRE